jgi:XRE family transcriptional regulator, aerobic/anaerobic benzoate catabolism transcriptional regulator
MTEDANESVFLQRLGQRVRMMRGLRGMSRKVLARTSGISERYIAQLESGKGNVSIVLLRRLAGAMAVHLEDLIAADDANDDWSLIRELVRKATSEQIAAAKDLLSGERYIGMSYDRTRGTNGIALIGLRGAGKSTLGRLLATELNWTFIELNKEIERQNGLSVGEIIAIYGQEGFHRMEHSALREIVAAGDHIVLATGGGIVSEPLTFDLVLSSYYTVWLKAAPEEHMARVRKQGDLRPMADDRSAMQELRTILLSREPLYARAAVAVDTAGQTVETAYARLRNAVIPGIAPPAQAVKAAHG